MCTFSSVGNSSIPKSVKCTHSATKNLVHEDLAARLADEKDDGRRQNASADAPGAEGVGPVRFNQRLPGVARQEIKDAAAHHDEGEEASDQNSREAYLQHEEHRDLVPSRAVPTMRNKLRYPGGWLA